MERVEGGEEWRETDVGSLLLFFFVLFWKEGALEKRLMRGECTVTEYRGKEETRNEGQLREERRERETRQREGGVNEA